MALTTTLSQIWARMWTLTQESPLQPSLHNNETEVWNPNIMDMIPWAVQGNAKHTGYDGYYWGCDPWRLVDMWPVIPMTIFFLLWRFSCQRFSAGPLATFAGIKAKSKTKRRKFGVQVTLFLFYTLSCLIAYFWVLKDRLYAGFPLTAKHKPHLYNNFPGLPVDLPTNVYYWWGASFYTSELVAVLLLDDKRADFWEYVIHHITTILLMTGSFGSYGHKVGTYVFFIHDISDIFLCVAKVGHYLKKDLMVYFGFAVFLVTFAVTRLWWFPILISTTYTTAPQIRVATYTFWILAYLLMVLQVLHVYWFALILRMVVRLITGVKGDVRSDDDSDVEQETKLKKENKKKKLQDQRPAVKKKQS